MLKKSLCLVLGFMCIGDMFGSKLSSEHIPNDKEPPLKKVCLNKSVSHIDSKEKQVSNIHTDEDWNQIIERTGTYPEKDLFNDDIKTALASRWDGIPINWDAIHTLADNGNSYAQFFWGEKLFNEAISSLNIEERIDITKKIELLKEAYTYILISGIVGKNSITMEEYDLSDIKISKNSTEDLVRHAQMNAEKSVL